MKSLIWILGAPGTGKGKLSKSIAEEYGIECLSMGELLRKSGGMEIAEAARRGRLIPDRKAVELIMKETEREEGKEMIFDGFPRTVEQYRMFKEKDNAKVELIIWLRCEKNLIMERIQNRALKEPGRIDSSPETVRARLRGYEEVTHPLLDVFHFDRMPCV
ncbi:MAG: adenylate kinase, partial [Amphiamblys sp. WSBS2006]